jgi:N-acetylmuramoyl-L-alanine amidase
MRKISHIVIHCTATPHNTRVESIQRYWRTSLGWRSPGYHYIIDAHGVVTQLSTLDRPTNGVQGHNARSIHIAYIGGVDATGKPVDNRTPQQLASMIHLLRTLHAAYPQARICGHRDFPGVRKACPSFDVATWLRSTDIISPKNSDI